MILAKKGKYELQKRTILRISYLHSLIRGISNSRFETGCIKKGYRWLCLKREQKSFPHWRGTLTSKIAMREIPDPKSTMGEWYNIKSFPVFKKTGKLFPCFFCYIGTFLYYEGNYFPVFEGKSLPVFLLYRNISLLSQKIIPVFLQIYH